MQTRCYFSDVIELWKYIRLSFPSIWIHDSECNIYNIRLFVKKFAIPYLKKSFRSNLTRADFKAELRKLEKNL
ncbi:MAG: hypothetical protein GF383_09730 [Candidatus Lokiarchaeota archaeon]|nr:hypothetical protein [Candidatus Lokiarchaeota archaeon]MBD3340803.1 hypothetical protein [Candidatus Lokiarchaeota archaeon]